MNWQVYLKRIYYDPAHAGSFSSAKKLQKAVRKEGRFEISLANIQKWLQGEETYTTLKPSRKKYPRNKVIVDGINDQWDSDLMDMSNVSKENDGVRYVLVAIDVFSRKGRALPMKTKTGKEVAATLEKMLLVEHPRAIRTDKGREYLNKDVRGVLDRKNILHSVTQNEVKANYAERFIKTIKNKLTKFMLENQSLRYVDKLQAVVEGYNNTYHRSIGMAPNKVTKKNSQLLWEDLYVRPYWDEMQKNKKRTKLRFRYKIGDTVRISHLRNLFSREYHQKWTSELFTIVKRINRSGIPVYEVKDWSGEPVVGRLYEQELHKVIVKPGHVFKIENILRSKGRGAKKEHLVHWLNWPKKYDSWVKALDIQEL